MATSLRRGVIDVEGTDMEKDVRVMGELEEERLAAAVGGALANLFK